MKLPRRRRRMPDEGDVERINAATTFADLFAAYHRLYPVPVTDPARVLRLATAVAGDYPGVELWDHLDPVLERAMRLYSPDRGPFPAYFALVLRRELGRAAATAARVQARKREVLRRYKAWLVARDRDETPFDKWGRILLDEVTRRLDRTAGGYLDLRRSGVAVQDIARDLGRAEGTLWNRFGGGQLSALVQQETRRMVAGLPADHRHLLAAHLAHEAELTDEQVERLFGVPLPVRPGVRVLEEEDLLVLLGWGGGNFGNPAGIVPKRREVLESGMHIACEHTCASRSAC